MQLNQSTAPQKSIYRRATRPSGTLVGVADQKFRIGNTDGKIREALVT